MLRKTPPAHPARPSRSPVDTVTEKSSPVPSRGTERKKNSHRPNCRHTPTPTPHTPGRPAHHSLRALARYSSNKGPKGTKPKTPMNTPKNTCAPPFPQNDAARNNAGRRRAILIDAIDRWRKEPHTGGTPYQCRQKTELALPRWSPPPIAAPFPRVSRSVHSPRTAPKIRPVANHPSQMSAAATQICRWTG